LKDHNAWYWKKLANAKLSLEMGVSIKCKGAI
jgi:hypothetical protein